VPCFLQLQYSCAPLIQKNILAYTRDPAVPGVNDILFPKTVQWNGVQYNDNILYRDFSTRMTVGENVAGAGYVVHKRGSWKVGGEHQSHCCRLHANQQQTLLLAEVAACRTVCRGKVAGP
jgi:hypothetical protein